MLKVLLVLVFVTKTTLLHCTTGIDKRSKREVIFVHNFCEHWALSHIRENMVAALQLRFVQKCFIPFPAYDKKSRISPPLEFDISKKL